jgi:hypothetical protein
LDGTRLRDHYFITATASASMSVQLTYRQGGGDVGGWGGRSQVQKGTCSIQAVQEVCEIGKALYRGAKPLMRKHALHTPLLV